jgi:hypothetical protein
LPGTDVGAVLGPVEAVNFWMYKCTGTASTTNAKTSLTVMA